MKPRAARKVSERNFPAGAGHLELVLLVSASGWRQFTAVLTVAAGTADGFRCFWRTETADHFWENMRQLLGNCSCYPRRLTAEEPESWMRRGERKRERERKKERMYERKEERKKTKNGKGKKEGKKEGNGNETASRQGRSEDEKLYWNLRHLHCITVICCHYLYYSLFWNIIRTRAVLFSLCSFCRATQAVQRKCFEPSR